MSQELQLLADASANKKQQKWQSEVNQQMIDQQWAMYERQRADANSDWARANAYNHPTEQMNRLRQAGVNPHMAFGKGGENTAAMIRGSSGQTPGLGTPNIKNTPMGKNAIEEFAALRQIQAQTDQTSQVTQNLRVDQLLKGLELAGKSTSNNMALVDFDVKKRMADDMVKKLHQEMLGTQWNTMDRQHQVAYEHANQNPNGDYDSNYTRRRDLEKENLLEDNRIKKQILQTGDIENKNRLVNQLFNEHGLSGEDPYMLKVLAKNILAADNMQEIDRAIQQFKNQRK